MNTQTNSFNISSYFANFDKVKWGLITVTIRKENGSYFIYLFNKFAVNKETKHTVSFSEEYSIEEIANSNEVKIFVEHHAV